MKISNNRLLPQRWDTFSSSLSFSTHAFVIMLDDAKYFFLPFILGEEEVVTPITIMAGIRKKMYLNVCVRQTECKREKWVFCVYFGSVYKSFDVRRTFCSCCKISIPLYETRLSILSLKIFHFFEQNKKSLKNVKTKNFYSNVKLLKTYIHL